MDNELSEDSPITTVQVFQEKPSPLPVFEETPQENEPAMDEALSPTGIDFLFSVSPSRRIKLAIEALADPEFNPTGKERIDVNAQSFMITALSPDNVYGCLDLSNELLDNFICNKAVEGKIIDLKKLYTILADADDEDSVMTVIQEHGSNQIWISCGNETTPERFPAVISENDLDILKFPDVTILCAAGFTSLYLDSCIQKMTHDDAKLVLVDITKERAAVFLENEKMLDHEYEEMGFDGTIGMEPCQRHLVWFKWSFPQLLQKAGSISDMFTVTLTTVPQAVLLTFEVMEDGGLQFLVEAQRWSANHDKHIMKVRQKNSVVPLPRCIRRTSLG